MYRQLYCQQVNLSFDEFEDICLPVETSCMKFHCVFNCQYSVAIELLDSMLSWNAENLLDRLNCLISLGKRSTTVIACTVGK